MCGGDFFFHPRLRLEIAFRLLFFKPETAVKRAAGLEKVQYGINPIRVLREFGPVLDVAWSIPMCVREALGLAGGMHFPARTDSTVQRGRRETITWRIASLTMWMSPVLTVGVLPGNCEARGEVTASGGCEHCLTHPSPFDAATTTELSTVTLLFSA